MRPSRAAHGPLTCAFRGPAQRECSCRRVATRGGGTGAETLSRFLGARGVRCWQIACVARRESGRARTWPGQESAHTRQRRPETGREREGEIKGIELSILPSQGDSGSADRPAATRSRSSGQKGARRRATMRVYQFLLCPASRFNATIGPCDSSGFQSTVLFRRIACMALVTDGGLVLLRAAEPDSPHLWSLWPRRPRSLCPPGVLPFVASLSLPLSRILASFSAHGACSAGPCGLPGRTPAFPI
jgi:hypothetical protein